MKTAIRYYTRSGNTEKLAEFLALRALDGLRHFRSDVAVEAVESLFSNLAVLRIDEL